MTLRACSSRLCAFGDDPLTVCTNGVPATYEEWDIQYSSMNNINICVRA